LPAVLAARRSGDIFQCLLPLLVNGALFDERDHAELAQKRFLDACCLGCSLGSADKVI